MFTQLDKIILTEPLLVPTPSAISYAFTRQQCLGLDRGAEGYSFICYVGYEINRNHRSIRRFNGIANHHCSPHPVCNNE